MSSKRADRSSAKRQNLIPKEEGNALPRAHQKALSAEVATVPKRNGVKKTRDRQFSSLFALSIDAIVIVDQQGQCLEANPAAGELCGLSTDDFVGQALLDLLQDHRNRPLDWVNFQQTAQGTCRLRTVDGTYRNVEYRLTSDFAPSCLLVLLRNLPESPPSQQQLESQKYQTLFEILPIGVCITDANGNLVEANPASEQILGISIAEQTQRTYDSPAWKIVRPDSTPMPAAEFASVRALQENRVIIGEEKGIVHPDGSVHWIRVSAAPIPLENYGVAIAYVDITNQKIAETELKQSHAYYKSLADVLPLCLYRKDTQGRLTFINQTCLATLNKTATEVLGKTVYDFYPPDLAAKYDADDRHVLTTGNTLNTVEAHQIPGQETQTVVQVVKAPVKNQQGDIIGTQGIYWDITERIQLEAALRESESKLNTILQSAIAAIYSFVIYPNEDWHYTYFSPGCATIFGYSPEELLANQDLLFSRIPTAEQEQLLETATPAIFASSICQFEFSFQHQDGSFRWLKATVYPHRDDGQDCWNVTVVAVDISDLKATEIALRQSEATKQAMLEAIPDLLIHMDQDGTYLQLHKSAELMLINPDRMEVGNTIFDILPTPMATERMSQIQQALATQRLQVYEYDFAVDGRTYYEEARIVPMGQDQVLLLVRDISDRKVVELTLRQQEREFRTLAEHSPDGILRLDQHFRFLYVNPVIAQQLGVTATYLIGKKATEIGFPAQLVQTWRKAIKQAFDTRQEQQLETQETRPIGVKIFSSRIVPELSRDGSVESVLIVSRDITDLKQAQAELLHQTERERLLSRITQHIRQSLDSNQVLTTAVEQTRLLLNADRVLIYRFNADGSGNMIAESVIPPWLSVIGSNLDDPCFTGELVEAYRQGKIHQIDDLQTYHCHPCYAELLSTFQIRANLVMPITDGTKLWGLFCIHHCAQPHVWQFWELELLHQLVDQLAIAIQQSELYHQVQQLNVTLENQVLARTADLQRSLEFEMLLKRITDQVRDSLDETEILETVVRELAEGLSLECCDTGIYNADHTTSTIVHEYARSPHLTQKGLTFAIGDAQNLDVYPFLFQGQAVQFCNRQPSSLRPGQGRVAILACPIWDDQNVLGDLWLFRHAPDTFSALEMRLVQQVANHCAIALRQSRLFCAAERQVIELEQLNRLKDDFLSTVSHELRTPMSNIKMATELLEIYLTQQKVLPANFSSATLTSNASPIERYFQILKDEGKREISLINDLLDLARIDAQTEPLVLTTIDLRRWIPPQLESFVTRTQQQQQALVLRLPSTLPLLTTDTSHLQRILHELLNNACKYTPPGETIRISARAIATDNSMELRVVNSGVSLSTLECDRIFERFYRIPNNDPWKHGGTGLGLALVKKLVEYMQGSIWAESKAKRLQFIIRLPLQPESSPPNRAP